MATEGESPKPQSPMSLSQSASLSSKSADKTGRMSEAKSRVLVKAPGASAPLTVHVAFFNNLDAEVRRQ